MSIDNTSDNPTVVGETSGSTATSSRRPSYKIERPGLMDGFNVYTAMLVVSFCCIALAILLLFIELSSFGSILESPWSTNNVRIQKAEGIE